MGKWENVFEQNEEKIFNALVDAEKQRHEWKNGSGYNVSAYLKDDGSIFIDIDTQSSFYPANDDMICIYCAPTFAEYIDPDCYTDDDIKQAVNQYYYYDARFICRQADLRDEDIAFLRRDGDEYVLFDGQVIKMDPSWDDDKYNHFLSVGVLCDQDGNTIY